jgi:hypothetical protein
VRSSLLVTIWVISCCTSDISHGMKPSSAPATKNAELKQTAVQLSVSCNTAHYSAIVIMIMIELDFFTEMPDNRRRTNYRKTLKWG